MFTQDGKPVSYAVIIERPAMDLVSLLQIWNSSLKDGK